MSTIHKQLLAAGLLASLGLTACSGSGTSPVNTTQANLPSNVLQFAVGTANLQGTFTGLNVAATYRQPTGAFHPGDSAVFVSTPSLSGPFTMPTTAGSPDGFFSTIATGPAPLELGSHTMGGTTQNGQTPTTFGTSGGVIGLGIEPFNYNLNGLPDGTTPYTQPLYDQVGTSSAPDPNAFVPWGGPPAFATVPSGATPFVSEGLDIFAVKPAPGAYTLNVNVPANTGAFTKTANAAIASLTPLPTFATPTVTLDGTGGGSINVTLPAGVTEAFVQMQDLGPGSCNGRAGFYYTFEVTASGVTPVPDTIEGATTLCTAAQNASAPSPSSAPDGYSVQAVGFDYPWFEASYPNSLGNPSPPIAGANGQADVTVSAVGIGPSTPGGAKVHHVFSYHRR
ncbi:MAG: hypothetical protein ABI346_03650 [Candidatus Baltobacteraceae bacterium]